jgi:hydrogenase maturation protease
MTRVVVIGYGNPSRGDDGIGPELLGRLEGWAPFLADRCELEVLGDFQLQVEHALDIEGRDLALFVDASMACAAPYGFQRLWPSYDPSYTTHQLSPTAVLKVYEDIRGEAPPPSYILSVRGRDFELGAPIGTQAAEHLEAAWSFLQRLLGDPRQAVWDALGSVSAVGPSGTNRP